MIREQEFGKTRGVSICSGPPSNTKTRRMNHTKLKVKETWTSSDFVVTVQAGVHNELLTNNYWECHPLNRKSFHQHFHFLLPRKANRSNWLTQITKYLDEVDHGSLYFTT